MQKTYFAQKCLIHGPRVIPAGDPVPTGVFTGQQIQILLGEGAISETAPPEEGPKASASAGYRKRLRSGRRHGVT